jgi:hypothetical protein
MPFKILAPLAVLAAICAAPVAMAQQTTHPQTDTTALPADLRAEIAAVFPDDVLAVPRDGYDAMFAKTEAFFVPFEAAGEDGHAQIRAAAIEDGHPNFFYYRAAGFLFDPQSPNSPDAIAALASLERVSPRTVNNAWYMMTGNMMAVAGLDTRRLALNWLDVPQAEIALDLGIHILYYSPVEAIIFSAYYGNEAAMVSMLAEQLNTATDPYEIGIVIHLLWETMTPEGRDILRAYAADETKPTDARAYALDRLAHKGDGPQTAQTMAELQRLRQEIVASPWRHNSYEDYHAISDEMAKRMQ